MNLYAVARRYAVAVERDPALSYEDLMQEGELALIEARKKYDPGRGMAFDSYAMFYVRKYMRRAIRRYNCESLDEPYSRDGDETRLEMLPAPEKTSNEDVRDALALLTEQQRAIALLAFSAGMNIPKIAKQLDIPIATVKRERHIAWCTLTRELKAYYWQKHWWRSFLL